MHIPKSSSYDFSNYLLLLVIFYHANLFASTTLESTPAISTYRAQTYQLTTLASVRDAPDGKIVAVWSSETRFTSKEQRGEWIKVSGTFPNDKWTPRSKPLWINGNYTANFTPQPGPIPSGRPKNIHRYITINKSDFLLKVFEREEGEKSEQVVYSAKVALGMDRCQPKEKGGKCYYTDPGEYQVRWKIYDPLGIEWCIPKSMEEEFKSDIAAGERCFRGSIGDYALNIGKTYAIHGTANPASIGTKASHGCVRTVNADMKRIFNMMDVGDKVYIVK
ncbi:MAG: L,D-transpeptidase [Chromatiales bacterium]|nr:L,D-transpeptidase [Chromatiales bacterium]